MDDTLEHNGKPLLSSERLETCSNLYHTNSPQTLWIQIIPVPGITPQTSMADSVLYVQVNCSSQTKDDKIPREWWSLPHAPYVATMLWGSHRKAVPATLNFCPHCKSLLAISPPTLTLTIYLNWHQTLKIKVLQEKLIKKKILISSCTGKREFLKRGTCI